MDDYDDENEKLDSKPGYSMEMDDEEEEEQDNILDDYGQEENENGHEGGSDLNLNQEETEAIFDSVTSGKIQSFKKLSFQAFCAAISHEDQVKFVLDYLCSKASSKFATAKNRICAYRVSQMDPVQKKEAIAEGFDDDGEDGAGDKILSVLQKMDIGNIMVVVCIWDSGVTIGENRLKGGEFFRMITDRTRELLTSIKEGVMQGQAARGAPGSPQRKLGGFNSQGA